MSSVDASEISNNINMIEDNTSVIERQVEVVSSDQNPLELLASESGLSKQKIKDAMTKGAVWLSKNKDKMGSARQIRRKNSKISAGNQLFLYFNPEVLEQLVESPTLVSDQGEYSVWNKPYGVWSHGSKWGDHCSIGRLVEQELDHKKQCFIVHRLDRAAKGLMVIAHNKKAAAALSQLFAKREVEKVYQAVIQGALPEASMVMTKAIDGKPAKSVVKQLKVDEDNNTSLVEVAIETGRKHQIRIHLASIGCPIVGDRMHGSADETSPNLQLTSVKIAFKCPITGKNQEFRV